MSRRKSYKKRRNFGWIVLLLIFVVTVVVWWVAAIVPPKIGVWLFACVIVPVGLMMYLAHVLWKFLDRKRIDGTREMLESRDFEVTNDVSREWLGPYYFLDQWIGLMSTGKVRWGAKSDDRMLLEHEGWVAQGKAKVLKRRTIMVWLRDEPKFKGAYFIRANAQDRKSIIRENDIDWTGDDQFDKHWLVVNLPEEANLSSSMRDILMSAPKGEEWDFGAGYTVLTFEGSLDSEELASFMEHGESVMNTASS